MFGKYKAQAAGLIALLAGVLAASQSKINRGQHDPLSKMYIKAAKKKEMMRQSFREVERRKRQIEAGWHPVVHSWKDPNVRVNTQGE
jgi:hypothetical protein